jgi:hypothetical protein
MYVTGGSWPEVTRHHLSPTSVCGVPCRYNNYQGDPYSSGHPLASVCGRQDLAPTHTAAAEAAGSSPPHAQAAHRLQRRRLAAEGHQPASRQQQSMRPLSTGRDKGADRLPVIPKVRSLQTSLELARPSLM